MFRIPSLVRGRRGYEEGEEWRERRRDDVMGRRGISDYYKSITTLLAVHTIPSSPSPHHHHTTHSPHRNDVISEVQVSGSHVDRLVRHQLKVGSCVTKSEEGFK